MADLQRAVHCAILTGAPMEPAAAMRGRIAPEAALRIHRDTVLAGLAGGLALSFPTVARLVGERFFDQMAVAFAVQSPPRCANLAVHGEGFPAFLTGHGPAAPLAYLPDVARLDWAIASALRAPDTCARRAFLLGRDVSLSLPASLTALPLNHPALAIREALESGDDAALGAIDLAPYPRVAAVWRDGPAARARLLTPPAGAFLTRLLQDHSADEALAGALGDRPQEAVLAAIQAEIFAAPFAHVTPITQDTTP